MSPEGSPGEQAAVDQSEAAQAIATQSALQRLAGDPTAMFDSAVGGSAPEEPDYSVGVEPYSRQAEEALAAQKIFEYPPIPEDRPKIGTPRGKYTRDERGQFAETITAQKPGEYSIPDIYLPGRILTSPNSAPGELLTGPERQQITQQIAQKLGRMAETLAWSDSVGHVAERKAAKQADSTREVALWVKQGTHTVEEAKAVVQGKNRRISQSGVSLDPDREIHIDDHGNAVHSGPEGEKTYRAPINMG